jgi:cyanophycin synthetase
VSALVEREMRGRRPALRSVRAGEYRAAMSAALGLAEPGDVVLVLYEKVDAMLGLLSELGAVPAEASPVGALRA